MESRLHKALKMAVERHMGGGCCWFESHMGPWSGSGSLRADVHYMRRGRSHYVECETRPSMERLLDKGRRRKQMPYGDVYTLVVPEDEYDGSDWSPLRGLFDRVYAYSVEEDRFTKSFDLRPLGPLRDAVLDAVMPVIRSAIVRDAVGRVVRRKNLIRHCFRCLLGRTDPWYWCWGRPCVAYTRLWGNPRDRWVRPF